MTDQLHESHPNTAEILAGLKDFQRSTVDYVFRRMYLDEDCVRRFLVADEVGLGKTLVARGIIAKTIDYLRDKTKRIDIVYVCSNTDIARQNINRLNVTEREDFSLSSRITLLPVTVGQLQHRQINFVSFTPGTSFDLKDSSGMSSERELLYWMLDAAWTLNFNKATQVLHAYAEIDGFRRRVRSYPVDKINTTIRDQFADKLETNSDLRTRFEGLCSDMPRAHAKISDDLVVRRNRLIGELRRLLAETCLHWLEPDLIILDEFQRFKHLLQGDSEGASEAAQLAQHLFNFEQSNAAAATAARVLLLSATPYKMFTQERESDQDDHYRDFQTTLDFLLPDMAARDRFRAGLREFRNELFRIADQGEDALVKVKTELEASLRSVIVRTERLALNSDRNGMLVEIPPQPDSLKPSELQHYLGLQRVANQLGNGDVLEYWKSAPYLLNFMEDYEFKRKLRQAIQSENGLSLTRAVQALRSGLLDRHEIERYQKLDPANSRMRSLHSDTIQRDAWRLLWIPPSLPYYEGSDPFVDPKLANFTKRLVFSCWKVVPKTIASVLSYEAERSMMRCYRKSSKNTGEARMRRRPLLRFAIRKNRPAGMPALAMLYPCRTLASRFDPLSLWKQQPADHARQTQEAMLLTVRAELAQLLNPLIERTADLSQPADERWYWAAPILLDLEHHRAETLAWFQMKDLAGVWSGEALSGDHPASRGWAKHVKAAQQLAAGSTKLGAPPENLDEVLALMALAGLGVASMRALERILPESGRSDDFDVRRFAGPLAHSFLHLFNLPEVTSLLRDRTKEAPYWRSVLEYAVAGNLQSVLDEYVHILVESLGLMGRDCKTIATEVQSSISQSLTLRTSTAKADIVTAEGRRVRMDDDNPIRFRTRFAMRFGDQDAEDSGEPTRADHVRSAFNSPFWPFVLATTSVGQEGLDFHPYCHAVVHWNLPSNPVDLEQREGRVHRYKGHALRKNIATAFHSAARSETKDPWASMFDVARSTRADGENDLFPFWITPDGVAKIERHVPSLPHSREVVQHANLRRSLVLYRMVFGQNRQEDLVEYLVSRLPPGEVDRVVERCRIDLSPPKDTAVHPSQSVESLVDCPGQFLRLDLRS